MYTYHHTSYTQDEGDWDSEEGETEESGSDDDEEETQQGQDKEKNKLNNGGKQEGGKVNGKENSNEVAEATSTTEGQQSKDGPSDGQRVGEHSSKEED